MISLRDVVTGFGNRDPLAEVWRRDLRGGGSSAEITGTLPLSFSGRGKPLTDYLISGNTLQNGTPTPEAPVDVMGCGVWDETRQSYKLPLTVNGTEYPIYLGEVESTRRIKKLVLTGEENYAYVGGSSAPFRIKIDGLAAFSADSCDWMCTHLPSLSYSQWAQSGGSYSAFLSRHHTDAPGYLRIKYTEYTTIADFVAWVSEQYFFGTPVTVWYVLAEPETGIVNEPLHKIGDYVDTISFAQAGVTIPTVNGANVLDMTATVKPSEVYIKGNGIKPTGYGQLVDNNSVRILDKNNVRILVHGQ